jgi:hypothetical protein
MKVWEVNQQWFPVAMVNESGVPGDTLSATLQLYAITPCSTRDRRSDRRGIRRIHRQ